MMILRDLDLVNFTEPEQQTICTVINNHSKGGHPFADLKTLPWFTVAFTIKCFKRVSDENAVTHGTEPILAKLRELQTRKLTEG